MIDAVELRIVAPAEQRVPMTKDERGYHSAIVDCSEGTRYFYVVNGTDRRAVYSTRCRRNLDTTWSSACAAPATRWAVADPIAAIFAPPTSRASS